MSSNYLSKTDYLDTFVIERYQTPYLDTFQYSKDMCGSHNEMMNCIPHLHN